MINRGVNSRSQVTTPTLTNIYDIMEEWTLSSGRFLFLLSRRPPFGRNNSGLDKERDLLKFGFVDKICDANNLIYCFM